MSGKTFTATIGIETHVQLKTKTKLFSAVDNDASQAEPNTLISHIDVGMPGALPVLNEKALELAVRAAFALNTKPQKFSKFDRKHYFYPDLPKGYQITQYEDPIITGGHVDILVDGKPKKVGVTRVHLEEDAGKNIHPKGADYSLVDLNRAGTPLLEIVSEPDLHSPAEAKAYARELYLLMKYADVSDANLYLGHMRFDVNVSVSTTGKPGTRSEVKNLNSFRSVENAVAYEIKRQTELLKKGEAVVQETRGWDEAKQKTTSQRGKEEAQDYRYMPEPDIPPIELSESYIKKFQKNIPVMPNAWRKELEAIDLVGNELEVLIEGMAEYDVIKRLMEYELKDLGLARFRANWLINFALPSLREGSARKLNLAILNKALNELYEMNKEGRISSNHTHSILERIVHEGMDIGPVEVYAQKKGFIQTSDEGEIDKIVAKVIKDNPKAADDVKAGGARAIGFLVGQVMAASKGQANPEIAQSIIKKQLGV